MHRLAEMIVACGRQATIIQENADFHPGWFVSDVSTISYRNWLLLRDSGSLSTNDVIIFPETYITAVREYSAGLASVIFNQNASYTFGLSSKNHASSPLLIRDLYSDPCIKHVLCVSRYDHAFLSSFVCQDSGSVSRIINGLEDSLFPSSQLRKRKQIVFMPRKNSFDSQVVSSLLSVSEHLSKWKIIKVDGLPHSSVISLLRSSLIFLSFGHPEGFGLPVAEALSCGCCVIGYSGLGGRELFEISSSFSIGSEIAVGDWAGFVHSVEDFALSLQSNPYNVMSSLKAVSNEMSVRYSLHAMKESVESALAKIESSL